MPKLIDGLARYCMETGVASVRSLTGGIALDPGLTDNWLRMAQQSG
jgi:dihydroorotate dehydrogenase (NAD+) catalytic subunit